jgi:hypothetical protein
MLVIPLSMDHHAKRDPFLIGCLTIGCQAPRASGCGLPGRLYGQSVTVKVKDQRSGRTSLVGPVGAIES